MSDRRRHRGPHPEDPALFGPPALPRLRRACAHLSWLLERGYASPSALKLVGDRFQLRKRQRIAVLRCAASDTAVAARAARRLDAGAWPAAGPLAIDAYNVLTTVEAALSGGVVLRCRDDVVRDMASVHGTWREVHETIPALEHIAAALEQLAVPAATWWIDRPVSNSARLAARIDALARERALPWTSVLVPDADRALLDSGCAVATSDSAILDRCGRWFDLAGHTIRTRIPNVWWVDLHGCADRER